MAHTIGRKIFSVLLMAGMLALSACAKKDDSAVVRVADRSGGTGIATTVLPTQCATGESAIGKIFDPLYTSGVTDYRPTVVSFLSSGLEDKYIGQIGTSPYDKTGVDFVIKLKFDANGVVLKASSTLEMYFYDSLVGSTDPQTGKSIKAYEVKFPVDTASAGELRNGQFTVIFKDAYGEVTVKSTKRNGEYTEGTVSYVNTVNVNSGTPTRGTLGSFIIRTCAVY